MPLPMQTKLLTPISLPAHMSRMRLLLIVSVLAVIGGTWLACTSAALSESTIQKMGIVSAPIPAKHEFEEFQNLAFLSNLSFSPSSNSIYFLRDGNIMALDPESKETKILLDDPNEPIHAFQFSPDGEEIYFEKDLGGSELYGIYRYDLKSKKIEEVSDGNRKEVSGMLSFSEDGKTLYFIQSRNKKRDFLVMTYDTQSGKVRELLAKENTGYVSAVPDKQERYLAYQVIHSNSSDTLYLKDQENDAAEAIVIQAGQKDGAEVSSEPLFFKDGKLYILSTLDASVKRLWVYDVATDTKKLLKAPVEGSILGLAYYPAIDRSILSYRGVFRDQVQMFEGLLEKRITLGIAENDIEKIVLNPLKKDIEIVVESRSDIPGNYYYVNGSQQSLVYNANRSVIPNEELTKSYSTFVKSFDGVEIPTHFLIPNGTSAENKRPVLLWVHGGPEESVDLKASNSKFQYITNQGYILVAPNVRGSSGYGSDFMNMDNGDWGGAHIKDLIAVSDYTKELAFVDPENIFILGGSFGGFSVLSAITQYPKYFRAAVDIFGPSELATLVDSYKSAAAVDYWLSEIGGDPRKDQALNRRISPFYHIDQIQIPLQVHHGANDIRVPIAQSEKIVQKLKDAGKEVEFFRYEDEGHGFVHKENEVKVMTEAIRFLNEHVK